MFRNLKVLSINVFIIAVAGIIFAFANVILGSATESVASTHSSSELSFQTARIAATVGTVVFLTVMLAVGLYIYSTFRKDQNALIHLKYGSLLIDLYESTYEPPAPVVEVPSIDQLAKLADRYGTMILHIPRDFLQDYLVQTDQVTYRYRFSTDANAMQIMVEPGGLGVTWGAGQPHLEDPMSRS